MPNYDFYQPRRRGGFNRGRGFPRRGSGQPASNPSNDFNRPEEAGPSVSKPSIKVTRPPVPSSAFAPKAVSTNYTAEKNDPCLEESAFLADGRKGYCVRPAVRRFENDYSQFITIVECSYQAICAADKGFHKRISYSMYQYYCVIALWKRLIDANRTTDEAAYAKYNRIFGSMSMLDKIPSEVASYLSCIGDIVDETGRPVHLHVQQYPIQAQLLGAAGHFGRVGPDTHQFYSTIPSPFVAIYRVLQDFNLQPDEDAHWDLPARIRPMTLLATLPNANLLGWGLASILTNNQRETLTSLGFQDDRIPARNIDNFPILTPLLSHVADQLLETRVTLRDFPSNQKGSLAQVPFSDRVATDTVPDTFIRIAAKGGISNAPFNFSVHITNTAETCRFRVRRHLIEQDGPDSLPYRFPGDVPNDWFRRIDQIFNYGIGNRWNLGDFTTAELSGHQSVREFIHRMRGKLVRE